MKKRAILNLFVAIFTIGLLMIGSSSVHAASKYVNSSTPTLFFHGWGSSSHAEEYMANGAKSAGASNDIVRANVSPSGKVTFNHRIAKNAKNPIVEVNIEDNKLSHLLHGGHDYAKVYPASANYVKDVVQAVEKQTQTKKVNFVGHSMGNLEIMYYIQQNANRQDFPQIDHFVSIAGHYDGIIGEDDKANQIKIDDRTGKPSIMHPEYKGLLGVRHNFPRETRVLNIFGNLDNGTNSDSEVSNASARSLKYLLNNRVKSYQELMIHGKNAQHSRLHHNPEVNRALIKFLWEK